MSAGLLFERQRYGRLESLLNSEALGLQEMSFVSSESDVLSCCLSRCCGSDPIRDGTYAPL